MLREYLVGIWVAPGPPGAVACTVALMAQFLVASLDPWASPSTESPVT